MGYENDLAAMASDWTEFDTAVSRWRIGELDIALMPDVAAQALTSGCGGDGIVKLAGMQGRSWAELEPEIAAVYADRGLALPTVEDSIELLGNAAVARVAAGEVDELAGAREIGALSKHTGSDCWTELVVFSALANDWPAVEQGYVDEAEHRKQIRDHAVRIRSGGGVRADVNPW